MRFVKRKEALKYSERLVELVGDDEELADLVVEVRNRIKLPMSELLQHVPGNTITERARAIGISRQGYYRWLWGWMRPNVVQAKRLAELTGYPVEEIRGRVINSDR